MARIDRHLRLLWMAAAVLAVVGCDPYPDRNTAAPEILAVFASNGDPYNLLEVDGTKTDTNWTITIPSLPDETDPTIIRAVEPVIIVQTNQSLDDTSIQTADDDCTPSGGWLSATPIPAPSSPWYSCYNPSAAVGLEGGSVVLFRASQPISTEIGWYEVASLDVGSYSLSGTVRDRSGKTLPISIQVMVSPP